MPWWKFWEDREEERAGPDFYEEGVALASEERYHEALTSFRLALRERPDDPAVLEQMAVVYTQIGVTEEAVKLYRRALEVRESPAAHYGIAFLLLHRGVRDEAVRHLRAFLDAAPSGAEAEQHVRHARRTLERLEAEGRETDEEREPAGEGADGGGGGRGPDGHD